MRHDGDVLSELLEPRHAVHVQIAHLCATDQQNSN